MEISPEEIFSLLGALYAENAVLKQNNQALVRALEEVKKRNDLELEKLRKESRQHGPSKTSRRHRVL